VPLSIGEASGPGAGGRRRIWCHREELIWPEKIVCGHSDHEEAAIGTAPSQQ